jgi:deazaflavin-dependent oxidoreductase (nitroreductase family)
MSKSHTFWYRLTGGALGSRLGGGPILLLTTTGRKSGKPRTTPLLYVEDGDNLVIVASNAGDDRDPGWWRNMKAHPEASVQIKSERVAVRSEQAGPADRARLWQEVTKMYPDYDEYTKRTTREIPVVILHRT